MKQHMPNRYAPVDLISSAEQRRISAKLLAPQYDTFFKYASDLDIADEGDGNVEAPVGWFALIDMGTGIGGGGFEAVTDAVKERSDGADWNDMNTPAPGFYVAQTGGSGIIWVYEFTSRADARSYYGELLDAFTAWDTMEQNDVE